MGRLRTTSCKQAKMRHRETVTPKRGNVPLARQPFTTTPAFRLSRRPTDLALKSSPTCQRRGLGLQSDGARCYNSQEFYG